MTVNQTLLQTKEVIGVARTISFHLVTFWGVLLAILIGAQIYKEEYRNGHLEMILSKPIPRWNYLLGRLIGSYIILLISLFSLGLINNIIYNIRLQTFDLQIWLGFGVVTFEILLVVIFVSTLSLILPRFISIIIALIAYLINFIMSIGIVKETVNLPETPKTTKIIWKTIYYITPQIAEIQSIASKTMSRTPLNIHDYKILIHSGGYCLILVGIAIVIFNRYGK
jgi:ABC-type transport system involved in multi-copper enzyme maturation permease subunit